MKPARHAMVEGGIWITLELVVMDRMHGREPAHDIDHVYRVVANASAIAHEEHVAPTDAGIATTAALLHELYTLPKNHSESSTAGDTCAVYAEALLVQAGAPAWLVDGVVAAIRDHAFSKGVVPTAVASQILQDADRLDALGAIGLARMWATCADMRRPFYASHDPFATARPLDDKRWGLDHVKKKLLLVPERLHTATARRMAAPRVAYLHAALAQLESEIGSQPFGRGA